MIGSINGEVNYKGANFIILEVNGVGYKVFIIPALLAATKTDQELKLFTLTYVREDQITLYGFSTMEELQFFELLLTVSGVGPKSAIGIMSLADISMLKSAIVSEDPSVFTKVSGIGRKTAERVIVELKGKLKDEVSSAPVAREHSDVLDALVVLGYSQQEAREALKTVPKDVVDLQTKIKLALRGMHK